MPLDSVLIIHTSFPPFFSNTTLPPSRGKKSRQRLSSHSYKAKCASSHPFHTSLVHTSNDITRNHFTFSKLVITSSSTLSSSFQILQLHRQSTFFLSTAQATPVQSTAIPQPSMISFRFRSAAVGFDLRFDTSTSTPTPLPSPQVICQHHPLHSPQPLIQSCPILAAIGQVWGKPDEAEDTFELDDVIDMVITLSSEDLDPPRSSTRMIVNPRQFETSDGEGRFHNLCQVVLQTITWDWFQVKYRRRSDFGYAQI
ncbi:hypothetical protein BLNAU_4956 [Blattamonas nauphoetae]|uniref:Uncharacterized protein n=1 Tax=Blattamonas nauphoetae TaxID=2049346 RepID=A0ABQ9Y8I6_9EUKA|nr:hypothetical protein BLNAU_4956 [Blattamonas nauphoetae]